MKRLNPSKHPLPTFVALALLSLGLLLLPQARAYISGSVGTLDVGTSAAGPAPSLYGFTPVVITATASNLTAGASGALLMNSGAGANVTNLLPVASASIVGCKFKLIESAAHTFGVRVQTGDHLVNGAALTTSTALVNTNSTIGDTAEVVLTAFSSVGTWTVISTTGGTDWGIQ